MLNAWYHHCISKIWRVILFICHCPSLDYELAVQYLTRGTGKTHKWHNVAFQVSEYISLCSFWTVLSKSKLARNNRHKLMTCNSVVLWGSTMNETPWNRTGESVDPCNKCNVLIISEKIIRLWAFFRVYALDRLGLHVLVQKLSNPADFTSLC